MAEDFTKYTLLDSGNNCITVNSATSLSIAGTTDDLYSLHSDKGAAHFSGDFEHIVATSGSGTGVCAFWGLSNVVDAVNPHDTKVLDDANNTFLYAAWIYSGTLRMYLRECQSGSLATDLYVSGAGTFYCEIERDEDTGTYGTLLCRIYSDSARTTLVDTLSVTLRAKDDFRTVYGAWSQYTSAGSFSVTVANLDLQEAGTTHTVTGAITLPALEVSGTATKKHIYEATGAITLPALTVSGTASKKHVYTATGAVTLPALEVSGEAAKKHIYNVTGAIELPALEVAGEAARSHTWEVTGDITLPALEVAGEAQSASGKVTHEVTGAITLPALEVSGTAAATTGKVTHEVTGAIVLPALEVLGEATRFHSWEVKAAVTLPALEVDGQAAVAMSLESGGETDFQAYSSEDEDYVTGMALVDGGLLLAVDWKQRATEAECL